jgi:hypothetical protein
VPDASTRSVITIILTKVFFMFFSCGELRVQFIGRSIAVACPLGRTKWAFSNLRKFAEGLWAEWLSDTPMCQAVGQGREQIQENHG